mgnify:FL=1
MDVPMNDLPEWVRDTVTFVNARSKTSDAYIESDTGVLLEQVATHAHLFAALGVVLTEAQRDSVVAVVDEMQAHLLAKYDTYQERDEVYAEAVRMVETEVAPETIDPKKRRRRVVDSELAGPSTAALGGAGEVFRRALSVPTAAPTVTKVDKRREYETMADIWKTPEGSDEYQKLETELREHFKNFVSSWEGGLSLLHCVASAVLILSGTGEPDFLFRTTKLAIDAMVAARNLRAGYFSLPTNTGVSTIFRRMAPAIAKFVPGLGLGEVAYNAAQILKATVLEDEVSRQWGLLRAMGLRASRDDLNSQASLQTRANTPDRRALEAAASDRFGIAGTIRFFADLSLPFKTAGVLVGVASYGFLVRQLYRRFLHEWVREAAYLKANPPSDADNWQAELVGQIEAAGRGPTWTSKRENYETLLAEIAAVRKNRGSDNATVKDVTTFVKEMRAIERKLAELSERFDDSDKDARKGYVLKTVTELQTQLTNWKTKKTPSGWPTDADIRAVLTDEDRADREIENHKDVSLLAIKLNLYAEENEDADLNIVQGLMQKLLDMRKRVNGNSNGYSFVSARALEDLQLLKAEVESLNIADIDQAVADGQLVMAKRQRDADAASAQRRGRGAAAAAAGGAAAPGGAAAGGRAPTPAELQNAGFPLAPEADPVQPGELDRFDPIELLDFIDQRDDDDGEGVGLAPVPGRPAVSPARRRPAGTRASVVDAAYRARLRALRL